jgi:hypothetical protein
VADKSKTVETTSYSRTALDPSEIAQLAELDKESARLEKEISGAEEAYSSYQMMGADSDTPDDLGALRLLAQEARSLEGAPPYSNIAAQLAMVRNPAFSKQWSDVTTDRVNAARRHFQRQGIIARQSMSRDAARATASSRSGAKLKSLTSSLRSVQKQKADLLNRPFERQREMTKEQRREQRRDRRAQMALTQRQAQRLQSESRADLSKPFPIGKEIDTQQKRLTSLLEVQQASSAQAKVQMMIGMGLLKPQYTAQDLRLADAALQGEIADRGPRLKRLRDIMKKAGGLEIISMGQYRDLALGSGNVLDDVYP